MTSILRLSILALALALATPAGAARTDWQRQVAEALGRPGTEMPGGIYRLGLPRTDLAVKLDGVAIKPALALGSWLAFRPVDDGTVMVMGDLVLTADEVNPVMKLLVESGLEVTALHNHLLRSEPSTMYMHVSGHGDPGRLASTLRSALAVSKTPLGPPAASPASGSDAIELDTASIEQALGHKGKVNGGVYQMSIPRAEPVRDDRMEVPEAMGSGIVINFQPTGGGKAAITGDFVLIGSEVQPVLKALRANGIEVTALHNHMLNDEPRMFFMHFWANDDARNLAQGLRTALAAVNVAKH
jgi:uncharacterized protein DUF1259